MPSFVYLSRGISECTEFADLAEESMFAAALFPIVLAACSKYHGSIPADPRVFASRVCPSYCGGLDSIQSAIETLERRGFLTRAVVEGVEHLEPVKKPWWKYPRDSHHEFTTVVKRRDCRCLLCGSEEDLQAHHIKPVRSNPELKDDPDNGVTLCATCHKATYRREHLFEHRLTQLVAGA